MLQEELEKDPQKKDKFEDLQHFLQKNLPLDLLGTNSKKCI